MMTFNLKSPIFSLDFDGEKSVQFETHSPFYHLIKPTVIHLSFQDKTSSSAC